MLVLVPAKSNGMTLFESRLTSGNEQSSTFHIWFSLGSNRYNHTVRSETHTVVHCVVRDRYCPLHPVGVIKMGPIGPRVRKHLKDKWN